MLDTAEHPIAGARVVVLTGSEETVFETTTLEDGTYLLRDVPVELLVAYEAMLLIVSPVSDRPPLGTNEGDYIQKMPISVREFVDPALIGAERELNFRTAYVPLQNKGYALDAALVVGGGDLTWNYPDDGIRGALQVTLRIAPGSIQLPAEGQPEITLTPIDYYKTPMRIPDGGAGALWTLQPRDIVFDPPAALLVVGERTKILGTRSLSAAAGDVVEIYGATFTDGWTKFGDATISALSTDEVELESIGGIISKGAWGHVFGAPGANAGAEVTCYNLHGLPWPCQAERAQSVNPAQVDWSSSVPLNTAGEDLACQSCTNIGAPEAQGSVALQIPYDGATAVITVTNPATGEQVVVSLPNVTSGSFRYDSVVHFTQP